MKPAPVILPATCAQRVRSDFAARIVGAGETALLDELLLGLIASRECPGHVLLETLALVPEWVKAGRVIVSGFYSPLEQQVLRSVLRRKGRVIKVLARGITDYRPTDPMNESRWRQAGCWSSPPARRMSGAPPAKPHWRGIGWCSHLPRRSLFPMLRRAAPWPGCSRRLETPGRLKHEPQLCGLHRRIR